MNNLTIQETQELTQLAQQFDLSDEKLKVLIIDTFIEYEALGGDQSEAGFRIMDVYDHHCAQAAITEIFNSKEQYLLDIVNKFVIISTLGDCPQCGSELQDHEESQNGIYWLDTECSNCDYSCSNEPDWDCQPGGYAYDS